MAKLYIGVPMTIRSAAFSSATRSSDTLIAAALSGECASGGVKAPPIQGASTNGSTVLTRSLTITDPPGLAALHFSTKTAVSLREVEDSKRGLASMASNVGTADLTIVGLEGFDDFALERR